MVDVETLALEDEDALMPQIAAVAFDSKTFEVFGEFSECISILDLKKHGFTTDAETIKWWGEQDPELRKSVMNGTKPGAQVAKEFDEFLEYHCNGISFDIWANGLLFDIPKLDYFMLYFDCAPLSFRTRYNRLYDLRTLRSAARSCRGGEFTRAEKEIEQGAKHNALDDCLWQIKSVELCMKMMRGDEC